MKDMNGKIQYRDKEYRLVFNLNVMERIQEEYGSFDKWGELTDGKNGEPNAKAVIFGFAEMLNEGLDIEHEENGTEYTPFTLKQVGRIITDVGMQKTMDALQDTVIESTKSTEKNG